jgi:hypothetical protein
MERPKVTVRQFDKKMYFVAIGSGDRAGTIGISNLQFIDEKNSCFILFSVRSTIIDSPIPD